jgi:hypothetical protein
MARRYWTHIGAAVLLAVAVLLIVRLHQAGGMPF